MRDALAAHNFKTLDELGAKFLEYDKHAGASRVVLPGENATPEEVATFHHAIGVPKDPKDYGAFEFDGVKPDPGMDAFARDIFPKAGVTKKAAETLVKGWNAHIAKTLDDKKAADAAETAKGEEALARKWGANHSANMDIAQRAAAHFGMTPEEVGKLKTALGPEKAMVFLHGVGHAVATDGENPDGGNSTFTITTPQQAKAEVDRMKADPSIGAILRDAGHKEHKSVKAKWDRLLDLAAKANT